MPKAPASGNTSIHNGHTKHKGTKGQPGFEGPETYTNEQIAAIEAGNAALVGDKFTLDTTFFRPDLVGNPKSNDRGEITPEIVAAEGYANLVVFKGRVNGKDREDLTRPGTSAAQIAAGFQTHFEVDEPGTWEIWGELLGVKASSVNMTVKELHG